MDEEEALKFNHVLTNRMNLLIMAVDGITDKSYISDFIMKMARPYLFLIRSHKDHP